MTVFKTLSGFAHPELLLLLALPLALLWWAWWHPGHRVALPFDHGRQPDGRVGRFFLNLAESLPALLLAIVIVILAGPQRLGEPKSKRSLTNIEFCVDISGSMNARFGEGTRYDASMQAIEDFLDFRRGDAFGLTFFGNNVLHWVPLTSDTSAIRCSPPFMKPNLVPPWFGGTEIGKALLACRKVLTEREEGDRMIVLISDGMSSDLMAGHDVEVAGLLKKDGIVVYEIHTAEGEVPAQIVNLTAATGGQAFPAGDPAALEAIFRQIDGMNKARLEKSAAETMDHFGPFAIAGLSVLGLYSATLLGLRYTPW